MKDRDGRPNPQPPPAAGATDDYLRQLELLMSLSREMVALARDGQWAALAEAEQGRQSVLASLGDVNGLGLGEGDPAVELIRTRLTAILEMNNEIAGLGHEVCGTLSTQIRRITDGRHARRAYLENVR